MRWTTGFAFFCIVLFSFLANLPVRLGFKPRGTYTTHHVQFCTTHGHSMTTTATATTAPTTPPPGKPFSSSEPARREGMGGGRRGERAAARNTQATAQNRQRQAHAHTHTHQTKTHTPHTRKHTGTTTTTAQHRTTKQDNLRKFHSQEPAHHTNRIWGDILIFTAQALQHCDGVCEHVFFNGEFCMATCNTHMWAIFSVTMATECCVRALWRMQT